jgi:hypothetical protein
MTIYAVKGAKLVFGGHEIYPQRFAVAAGIDRPVDDTLFELKHHNTLGKNIGLAWSRVKAKSGCVSGTMIPETSRPMLMPAAEMHVTRHGRILSDDAIDFEINRQVRSAIFLNGQ